MVNKKPRHRARGVHKEGRGLLVQPHTQACEGATLSAEASAGDALRRICVEALHAWLRRRLPGVPNIGPGQRVDRRPGLVSDVTIVFVKLVFIRGDEVVLLAFEVILFAKQGVIVLVLRYGHLLPPAATAFLLAIEVFLWPVAECKEHLQLSLSSSRCLDTGVDGGALAEPGDVCLANGSLLAGGTEALHDDSNRALLNRFLDLLPSSGSPGLARHFGWRRSRNGSARLHLSSGGLRRRRACLRPTSRLLGLCRVRGLGRCRSGGSAASQLGPHGLLPVDGFDALGRLWCGGRLRLPARLFWLCDGCTRLPS
mmetsp:Transcript_13850/g.30447  ORF Transcript_13850/g.30447 Transcript_13850/m.30447 type:complete len:312 (+) Transcript_13850:2340-3275(+)